ncbi:DUF881 domain-containing protein [Syntrophomonas erecta]
MRSKGAQISIAVVCLVLGIMLAIQFKTTESIQPEFLPERVSELTQKLGTVTDERNALAEEVLSLREQLKNLRQDDRAMADLQEELQKTQMMAGLVGVKGPGLTITLNDSSRNLQTGENANSLLIHDQDLLIVVNELKASGAEAISVNDRRITAMSEIRCAGTTILVNWDKIAPPFVIKAIGNPDMLESGVNMRGGHLEFLRALGMQVHIQREQNLVINAYSGSLKFNYGVPMEYKEKEEAES